MNADLGVFAVLFVAIGVVIMTNLPPNETGRFFLLGVGSVGIGAGFAIAAVFGGRRGR